MPNGPAGLAFAGGAVWVGTLFSDSVYRIDPATNRTTRVTIGSNGPVWFSGAGDTLWVSNGQDGTASRIDVSSDKVVATAKTGMQPVDGTLAPDGLVWIPNLKDGTVTRLDPQTGAIVSTFHVGKSPFVLNVSFGDVWSPDYGGNQIWRIRA